MFDLLTIEEDAQAASEGWSLNYVFDLQKNKWIVEISPSEMATTVIGMARMNHPLALKALRLVAAPITRKGKK